MEDLAAALAGVDCVFSIVTPPLLQATTEDF
jgi:hypothetical protein